MIVRLTGKTKRGKQIVKNGGSEWQVRSIMDRVEWTADVGPWALAIGSGDLRWIHMTSDKDFEVERLDDDE